MMKETINMSEDKNGKNVKRVVYLIGDITEEKSLEFIKEMFKLEMENPLKDIVIIIDSYGGWVDAMWSMQDTMRLLRCKIHTLCVGKAMSCGQLILVGGDKGCRYATPNSRIMMHEITDCTMGTVTDIKNYTQELYRMDKQFREFLIKRTKVKKAQLNEMLKKDYYMTPEEALELGFIDKIVKSFGDIEVKGW
jgi:ATP-dependent Clp protease protease subunit